MKECCKKYLDEQFAGDSEMAETAIELRKTAALHDTDASASLVAKLESFAKEL